MPRISNLTEITTPGPDDMLAIVNAGATKKARAKNLHPLLWARVHHNTTQSIANATVTALAFNSETADTDTIHDTSTNNQRLTCKTAGIYLIVGQVAIQSNATGFRAALIRLNNGATYIAAEQRQAVNGDGTFMTVSSIYPLAVNDFVTLEVYQNSGGSLNAIVSSGAPSFMMICLSRT